MILLLRFLDKYLKYVFQDKFVDKFVGKCILIETFFYKIGQIADNGSGFPIQAFPQKITDPGRQSGSWEIADRRSGFSRLLRCIWKIKKCEKCDVTILLFSGSHVSHAQDLLVPARGGTHEVPSQDRKGKVRQTAESTIRGSFWLAHSILQGHFWPSN